MAIKLIVTDLDGTLLSSDGSVSPAVTAAFDKAAAGGVQTVLCTGRGYTSTTFLEDKAGNVTHGIYLTGCELMDVKNRTYLYQAELPRTVALDMLRYTAKHPACYMESWGDGRYVLSKNCKAFIDNFNRFSHYFDAVRRNLLVVDDAADYFEETGIAVNKFFFYVDEPEQFEPILAGLPHKDEVQMVCPTPRGLDIMPRGVNKGVTLRLLLEELGLREDEVMVCGDSENDAAMFLPGVLKVAMGNGFESLKEKADYVTGANDEDGLARAIEKFVL